MVVCQRATGCGAWAGSGSTAGEVVHGLVPAQRPRLLTHARLPHRAFSRTIPLGWVPNLPGVLATRVELALLVIIPEPVHPPLGLPTQRRLRATL